MANDRDSSTSGSTLPLAAELSVAGHSVTPDELSSTVRLDHARYRELEVVGEGGLGTVLRARDELLGRDIALKRIGPRVRAGMANVLEERFLREARITARLDHPGIVPVHDAGVSEDGRMYYTMRLIRGRSLAEVLAESTTLASRLQLIGAITAACHAVGHAHREGVIHCDLKPANLMIGPLGETQVVDWGLAEVLAERSVREGFAGTPAYASPEVLRGEPATVASDVWALGVTLHEAIAGALRSPSERPRWPEGCPPELAAIGDRAMAETPHGRYPDAQAMALDLEAFRDGRRVVAHQYSATELFRRLVVAWRWPLAVTGTLVLGTIVALAVTAVRTEAQRERAVAAEQRAQQQLGRAEAALSDALAKDAVAALRTGAIARAEHAAIAALRHGEHPDARGVLAAVHAAPRPRTSRRVELPGCRELAAISKTAAVCLAGEHLALWELPPSGTPAMRWTRPVAAVGAVALAEQWIVAWGPDATLYVLDRASGAEHARHRGLSGIAGLEVAYTGERVVAHDGRDLVAVHADGTIAGEAVCDARGIAAAATSSSETFVVCTGGELGRVGTGGYMALRPTPFGVALAPATALALSETGMELAIGSATGDVQVHDMRGCFSEGCKPVAPSMLARVLPTAIRKLACLGNDVIAIGDRGDAAHIGRGSIGELTRLPIAADRPIVFLEGGEIVVGGKAHHAWSIDDTARPSTLQAPRGVVAAAVSPSRVVGLTGGGEVLTWDARRGDRSRLLDGAVAIAIDPTGERIAAATASAMHVYAATGEVVARIEEPGVRRVAFLGGEWIAIGDSWLRRGAGARLPIPTVRASTISGAAWIVDPDLAVWRILETAERVGTAVGAVAIAAARDNHRLFATATTHRVRLGDWELAVDDGEVTGLALDAAGARLAIASSRGVIEVWSTGERRLLARATNLDQRARWLEVRDDELWAAGDDGAIRRWDLRAVTRPLPELEQMALATWGPP